MRSHRPTSRTRALLKGLVRSWSTWIAPLIRMMASGLVESDELEEISRREDEDALVRVQESLAWSLWRWQRIIHWRILACASKRTPLALSMS